MIELGGEVIARGRKPNNQPWKIGIDQPLENADERKLQAIVPLVNKAMATSGNYRQFYVQNGIKYAHTINPKTGYPVTHSLLSATVITNDCALADGYATAFMVMGVNRSKEFLRTNPQLGLDVLFIYANTEGEWETFASEGMKELIQQVD
jgi:thiamine biosynthesis lipoprotein